MTAGSVTVVDYGVGNLLSVRRAFEHCGATVRLTDDPQAIRTADRLVLPGVGAFGDCMAELRARRLVEPVVEHASTGRPFLGICVGMQILLEEGDEFGRHEGLGLVQGRVEAIPGTAADGARHKIPHIGWTPLQPPEQAAEECWQDTILKGVAPGTAAYFVHSFTAVPRDPRHRLADCHYGGRLISAAVRSDNVTGTQFHPEKSGEAGLGILSSFLDQ